MDSLKHMGFSLHLFTFVKKHSGVLPYAIWRHDNKVIWVQ